MFERYTEPARRVIFFARYEASQFGSAMIESEHILLGLIREDENGIQRFLPGSTTIEAIRRQIQDQVPVHERTSTSIDIPLSDECRRILRHTAEESKELGHQYIDTSHLLLGILREETGVAAKVLKGLGLELKTVRGQMSRTTPLTTASLADALAASAMRSDFRKVSMPEAGAVPDDETAKQVAEAVWFPRISALAGDQIVAQNATLSFGVWLVTGFLRRNDTNTALAAFIQKEDGKILRLHMEKLDS